MVDRLLVVTFELVGGGGGENTRGLALVAATTIVTMRIVVE